MASNVTVVMSVYNGERYLRQAIDSILSQTYQNFEFVIIDDGSNDNSAASIKSYTDSRISFIQNKNNIGLANSLNHGLALAGGNYIARMDADDVSLPGRLEKQVLFLDTHPSVGICGTWVETIGEPAGHIWSYPTDDAAIRSLMLFESALSHPAAMLRRAAFESANLQYNPDYQRAQDYELWVRAANHTVLANLAEVLLYHRLHSKAVGQQFLEEQIAFAWRVRLGQLRRMGIEPTEWESTLHQQLSMWQFQVTREFILKTDTWLQRLQAANMKYGLYPFAAFNKVLSCRWWSVCNSATRLGWWTWHIFSRSPLSKTGHQNWYQNAKFALKCRLAYAK